MFIRVHRWFIEPEATEEDILQAMHPHPTYSEAIMEAAGQGLGDSVHI